MTALPSSSAWFPPGLRPRLGLALGPALFLACGFGLGAARLEPAAAWAGATIVLMACWWITEPVPLWATACVPLLVFPLLGVTSLTFAAVALQYLDPINFLFFGGMLIAAAMEKWGLHRRIALGIVARIGSSPRRLVLGFMLATAFVSLWISNTAAALMMFPIGMAVLRRFEDGLGRDDARVRRLGLALMLGIGYAASLGGIGTKIGTGTNLIFVKLSQAVVPRPVDFVTWLALGLPVLVVALPLVWLYLVRVAAPLGAEDLPGGRESIAEARARLGRMGCGEVAALGAFLAAAALWVFRRDLELGHGLAIPGWWAAVPFAAKDAGRRFVGGLPAPMPALFRDVGDAVVALACGGALLLIPVGRRPARFALGLRDAAGISWGMLALLGGGFAMAYGVKESGLSHWIGGAVRGLDRVEPFLALLIVCLVSTALTEVASNTATASILLPLLAAGTDGPDARVASLMLAATLSASFGFMLPAGTPPNAIVYASGYIPVTRMARSGLAVDLAGVVLVAAVCYVVGGRVLQ